MRLLRFLAAGAAFTTMNSAAPAAGVANVPERILLTDQNQSQTVDVVVGQSVVLSLPENATTGYRWEIDRLDANLVETAEPTPRYPSTAVGSSGRVEWVFLPKAPGNTEIALKQWRSWEGDRSVVERFRVQLRISP
jgi:inhibitor of cysteine peptidase